jgi:hypothetical protein
LFKLPSQHPYLKSISETFHSQPHLPYFVFLRFKILMMDQKTKSMLGKSKSVMGFNVYYHTAPLKNQSLFCVLKCVNIFKKKNNLRVNRFNRYFFSLYLSLSVFARIFSRKSKFYLLGLRPLKHYNNIKLMVTLY